MSNRRSLIQTILANGKIEGHEVELLQQRFAADGKIDRNEADMLVVLYKRVEVVSPAFEKLFQKLIKQHLLDDGHISKEKTAWLRSVIFADNRISDREKKLLRELRGEAKQLSTECQALFDECLTPQGRNTA